jgi:hypothetical protein
MEHPAENLDSSTGTTPHVETPVPAAAEETDPKEKRHLEQLKGRELQVAKLETQLIEIAVDKVEQDNEYFLELFEKDPTIAEKVAKQFGVTAKEAIDKVNAAKGIVKPMEKQPFDKEALFKEWKERQEQELAMTAANKQFDGLDAAKKDVAQRNYQKLRR